jgi:crotonobetainyl-CoA:carnitine CoA-transferase CaiB-like acyl-CoA transferase
LHAVFCTLLGLAQKERGGGGGLIELPFVETALNLMAEPVAEYDVSGQLMTRMGNRSLARAPQGVYPCAEGKGSSAAWLAISVEDDTQWKALIEVLGLPGWASDLADLTEREAAHDRIDEAICGWSRALEAGDAARYLIERGIPAAPVTRWRHGASLEQIEARGLLETLDHPVAGRHAYYGLPLRFDRSEAHAIPGPAPTLGEHNEMVLRGLLGLSDADLERLRANRIIGERPIWAG